MCGSTHTLSDALIDEARGQFTDLELAELLLVAGQANLNNRVGNMAKQLVNFEPDGSSR